MAIPTMLCSAMKHSKKRSGKARKNSSVQVEFLTSPSSATLLH
jgi:hypothetical protein